MPTQFDLPTLSDKDYAKLKQELTAAIPKYSSNWSDFNYSDPGTTLLQLLSFIGDATLYRIDAVPTALYLNFLRLLVGATGEDLVDLISTLEADVILDADGNPVYLGDNEIVMDPDRLALAQNLLAVENGADADATQLRAWAMAFWRAPYRAVTAGDFAALTKQVAAGVGADTPEYQVPRVVVQTQQPYVVVVPITAYPYDYTGSPNAPAAPGRVLMTLVSQLQTGTALYGFQSYGPLIYAIDAFLQPRRLLGSAVQVIPPVFNPLLTVVRLACLSSADPAAVVTAANQAIIDRFSPLTGGADGKGWPYGRAAAISDMVAALAGVPGIDHSQPLQVRLDTIKGVKVGAALVGTTTYLGPGEQVGLPLPWVTEVDALTDTWTLQVGAHARVGVDTVLPYPTS